MRHGRFKLLTGLALICTATWLVPAAKADAALGRFSYFQLMAALAVTVLFFAAALVVLSPRRLRRARAFKILAILLGVLAALGAVELYATLAPPKENPFYDFNEGGITSDEPADARLPFTRPPYLKWEGWSQGDVPEWIPDPPALRRRLVFQTDGEGFRNSKDIAQADLVFIGDSYTEAGNVLEDETFVLRTAAKLNRSARNLGLFNYSPPPELIVLENFGLKCAPKTVVWQLCESNDLRGALQYALSIQQWDSAGRPPIDRRPTPRYTSREQRSPTCLLFRSLIEKKRWWLAGTFRDSGGATHEMRFGYWPTEHHYPLGHPDAPWGQENPHPAWSLLADSIRNAKAALDQRGIDLVVLYIPMKLTVFASHVSLDEWSKARAPQPLVVPGSQSLATQLNRVCREAKVPLIDTTAELEKAAAAGEVVYFPNDTHLSPRGHEIVSDMLADVLNDVLTPAE